MVSTDDKLTSPIAALAQEQLQNILPYVYSPLLAGHFRLLVLLPGEVDSPISVTLHLVELERSKNTYEALSYVWGNTNTKQLILCDGCGFQITINLFAALLCLKLPSEPRVLWIDAICINQEDIQERNQQVPLMKYIYPNALDVIVWLGVSSWNSDLALAALREWRTSWKALNGHGMSLIQKRQSLQQEICSNADSSSKREALRSLLSREWFTRCWTFQEVVLASAATVICGEATMTWRYFSDGLSVVWRTFPDEILPNMNALHMNLFRERQIAGRRMSLLEILDRLQAFKATDPRDIIFSLLGLIVCNDPALFRPTYETSVRDTYVSFTRAMIKDANSLAVLSSVDRNSPDQQLPSWVPDWRVSSDIAQLGSAEEARFDFYGGLGPPLRMEVSKNDYHLKLAGVNIDAVKYIYLLDSLKAEFGQANTVDGLSVCISNFLSNVHSSARALTGQNLNAEVLFRTLLTDFGVVTSQKRGFTMGVMQTTLPTHYQAQMAFLNLQVSAQKSFPASNPLEPTESTISPLIRDVYNRLYGLKQTTSINMVDGQEDPLVRDMIWERAIVKELKLLFGGVFHYTSFFITARGLVGTASKKIQPGDVICSFFGARVPFFLRAVEGTDYFKLIGDVYVDGIMDGELFQKTQYGDGIEPTVDWVQMRSFTIV